jgi:hypothetical protein
MNACERLDKWLLSGSNCRARGVEIGHPNSYGQSGDWYMILSGENKRSVECYGSVFVPLELCYDKNGVYNDGKGVTEEALREYYGFADNECFAGIENSAGLEDVINKSLDWWEKLYDSLPSERTDVESKSGD